MRFNGEKVSLLCSINTAGGAYMSVVGIRLQDKALISSCGVNPVDMCKYNCWAEVWIGFTEYKTQTQAKFFQWLFAKTCRLGLGKTLC